MTPARCSCCRRRLSSARERPGLPLMSSLNRVVPVSRSRTMWMVQRSPSSSAEREIGQYWPYVFMRQTVAQFSIGTGSRRPGRS